MSKSLLISKLKRVFNHSVAYTATRLPSLRAADAAKVLPLAAAFYPARPQNFGKLPAALARLFEEEIRLPAVELFTVRDVSVSWHMVVFDYLRMFLPALAHPREEKHYQGTYLLLQWRGRLVLPPSSNQELALVHNQWTASNYYHWLIDSLPRLLLLQTARPGCRLVMPAPVPAFVQESAALLGFTDFLLLERGQVLRTPRLLVPGHTAPPGYQRPELLRQLRARLLAAIYPGQASPVPYRKVYVTRRQQRVRRLLNEEEIADLLTQYGYETVEFEGLSLAQQVRLMTETKSFISLHGAGLTNMLFLPPGTPVAELLNADKLVRRQNKDFENLIYFRMASALTLPYYCLPCANVDDDPPTNEAHLRVDVAAFGELLQMLAAHSVS